MVKFVFSVKLWCGVCGFEGWVVVVVEGVDCFGFGFGLMKFVDDD